MKNALLTTVLIAFALGALLGSYGRTTIYTVNMKRIESAYLKNVKERLSHGEAIPEDDGKRLVLFVKDAIQKMTRGRSYIVVDTLLHEKNPYTKDLTDEIVRKINP